MSFRARLVHACGACGEHNVSKLGALADYARSYRFFRLNTLNYYGTDGCARFKSQCDCCEPLYMRFHIKERKHQDEIKALVQSKEIDTIVKNKRHPVHFKQVCCSATLTDVHMCEGSA